MVRMITTTVPYGYEYLGKFFTVNTICVDPIKVFLTCVMGVSDMPLSYVLLSTEFL